MYGQTAYVAFRTFVGIDPTAVTAPIISARSVAQLQPSLEAQNLKLTDEAYERIEALSVRPAPATDRLEEAVF